jgi:hypothetical protein
VLHLQSFISGIAEGLCVIYEPLAPVRLLQDLRERGTEWIAIDRDAYLAMGCNILAVRPGVVVMVDGAPDVRRALEARGIAYEPYAYKTGMFERAWPHFRAPIETHWRAFVHGTLPRDEAIKRIVAELK